jgi:LysR family transcriptional regulator (chromosome initiation inhibitor)
MRNEYETRLGVDQLAALAAAIEFGSFDAAADRLHVTPSAVSQRIKALEQRVGQVLVIREKPCSATPAGIPLLRLAAQSAMLESEALTIPDGSPSRRSRNAVRPKKLQFTNCLPDSNSGPLQGTGRLAV